VGRLVVVHAIPPAVVDLLHSVDGPDPEIELVPSAIAELEWDTPLRCCHLLLPHFSTEASGRTHMPVRPRAYRRDSSRSEPCWRYGSVLMTMPRAPAFGHNVRSQGESLATERALPRVRRTKHLRWRRRAWHHLHLRVARWDVRRVRPLGRRRPHLPGHASPVVSLVGGLSLLVVSTVTLRPRIAPKTQDLSSRLIEATLRPSSPSGPERITHDSQVLASIFDDPTGGSSLSTIRADEQMLMTRT
jgi:hypothetical protein